MNPPFWSSPPEGILLLQGLHQLDALMRIELAAHSGTPWTEAMMREELGQPHSVTWGIQDGQGVVQAMLIFWDQCHEIQIMDVAVHPEAQRQGLAKRLVLGLVGLAAHERDQITLEVRASNLPAQALYVACGFEVVGRRPKYYQSPREDALIMTYRGLAHELG